MSVSELRAKFGAAPPPLHQNAAAAAAVVAGTSEHASHWSSSFKGAPASTAVAGAANRQSSGGAFGVVLKPALLPRPGTNIDANGNDSEPGAVAAKGGHTNSARPLSPGGSKSAAGAAAPASSDAVAAGKPHEGVTAVVASPGASAAAKPTTSPGFGKPAPAGVKPSTLAAAAAAAGTAGKPPITGRPVGLGISRPNAAAAADAAGNQTNHSPPATSSGDAPLSPSVAQAAAAIRAKLSPPVTSPTKEGSSSTLLKSTTSGASPLAAAAAVGSGGQSKGSGGSGGSPALEAARSYLRKVQQPAGSVAGRGVTFPSSPAAAEALSAAAAVAHAGTAAQVQGDVANVVVCDSSGAQFQCLPFVTPRDAAPPKPDSEAGSSIGLPVVAWSEDSKLPAAAKSSPPVGNRSLSLIVPTTEEEEVEYDDTSSGSGSFRGRAPPMPPRLVTGRPEAAATARARSETESSAAPEETESTYDEGFSAANDEETFEEYDDIAMAPQLPARNSSAKSDPKEAQRRQKEEEKRQKAKEKEEKEQRAKEKKEKGKKEKEEQKREAELQKLLASFKVSAADQPQCEATVTKAELLKPGKNELQVKAGERLFILAKDARGKWLAKSGSGAIGTISASNVTVIETGSGATNNGDDEYADVEEVYSVLDD